jgi:hypothetical protein
LVFYFVMSTSRPLSDSQYVQFVGLDERENSQSVYSYVTAPSYDSATYVYPSTTPIGTDLSVVTESEAAQSPTPPAGRGPKCCGRKLCAVSWLFRVSLVMLVVAIVMPYWFHSSATFVVPSAPPAASPPAFAQPQPDLPPSGPVSAVTTPAAVPAKSDLTVQRARFRSSVTMPDNSTVVSVKVHSGLWRVCANGGECQKLGCCKHNRPASLLCGKSKPMGCLLIASAACIFLSMILTTCCTRRGKFQGSRKIWIAPFLLFVALVLGVVSLVLAARTRHTLLETPLHAGWMQKMLAPRHLSGDAAEGVPHGDGHHGHHGSHHHGHHAPPPPSADPSESPSEASTAPPMLPVQPPMSGGPSDDAAGSVPAPTDQRPVTTLARDVQFGSSFYLVVMALMSLFYGWLGLLRHACHQRCKLRHCAMRQ